MSKRSKIDQAIIDLLETRADGTMDIEIARVRAYRCAIKRLSDGVIEKVEERINSCIDAGQQSALIFSHTLPQFTNLEDLMTIFKYRGFNVAHPRNDRMEIWGWGYFRKDDQ